MTTLGTWHLSWQPISTYSRKGNNEYRTFPRIFRSFPKREKKGKFFKTVITLKKRSNVVTDFTHIVKKHFLRVAVKKLTATIQIFYLGLGLSRSARSPAFRSSLRSSLTDK